MFEASTGLISMFFLPSLVVLIISFPQKGLMDTDQQCLGFVLFQTVFY